MQATKLRVQHNEQLFDVVFVTVSIKDTVFFQILNNRDIEMKRAIATYLARKMLEYYEIDSKYESISIGAMEDEDMYIEIIPNVRMEGNILEVLAQKILPKTFALPVWSEWHENEFLNEFLDEIVDVVGKYDEKNVSDTIIQTKDRRLYTYIIPSLHKLLNFSGISGSVVEQDGKLYLRTINELSEFFENCNDPLRNATVVISNVEKMLESMQKEDSEQEEIEK